MNMSEKSRALRALEREVDNLNERITELEKINLELCGELKGKVEALMRFHKKNFDFMAKDERIAELKQVYDHPNHGNPKERYLYEIRCAIKLLRENGSEYAFGVAVQLDQFYKRARKALKGK